MSAIAPFGTPARPGPPCNTQEFLAALSSKFHCMQGPPRAYIEIPTDLHFPWGGPSVWRGVYTSLRLASWARREDCERQLFAKLWEITEAARAELIETYGEDVLPLVFWRTMPHIVEEPPTIPGEEVGGSSTPHREFHRTHLFARLWIPGAPEFAKLNSSHNQETVYV